MARRAPNINAVFGKILQTYRYSARKWRRKIEHVGSFEGGVVLRKRNIPNPVVNHNLRGIQRGNWHMKIKDFIKRK